MQHSTINYVEALLIGGPHDGQRVNIMEGIPQLRMAEAMPARLIPDAAEPPAAPVSPVLHTYTRSGFGIQQDGQRGMFYLYVHQSLPSNPIAAVQMLYDGYRKPAARPKWEHDLGQLNVYQQGGGREW